MNTPPGRAGARRRRDARDRLAARACSRARGRRRGSTCGAASTSSGRPPAPTWRRARGRRAAGSHGGEPGRAPDVAAKAPAARR